MTDDYCPIDHDYVGENSGLDLCPVCREFFGEVEPSVRIVPSLLPPLPGDGEEIGTDDPPVADGEALQGGDDHA